MRARLCNSLLRAAFFLALCLFGFTFAASAKNPTYVEFDYPNANSTNVTAINLWGTVTGMYCDVLGCHGYLRTLPGKLTSFDYPGASETQPLAIDALGRVVGIYSFFPDYLDRTFLRAPDGTFTDIDPPDAMWSITSDISPTGVVTGYYGDALYPITGETHGFEYTPGGTWTTLDVPGEASTQLEGRNLPGFIVGVYDDSSFTNHGFLRTPAGSIISFDAPDASNGLTFPTAINLFGQVAGYYLDANFASHVFVRSLSGGITEISAPDAGTGLHQGTIVGGLDPALAGSFNLFGSITGCVTRADDSVHGFVRSPDGTLTEFDSPSASVPDGGTCPTAINDFGLITGTYTTETYGEPHGFLRIP